MESENQVIVGHIGISVTFGTPTIWQHSNWAEFWLSDACKEIAVIGDPHARRREIVFSVCFVESYFVEWVREVLRGKGAWPEFERLLTELLRERETLKGFLAVMRQMKAEGHILTVQEKWSGDLERLFNYRNWLVHGRASRVYSRGISKREARPTPDELRNLAAGWATRTAADFASHLCRAAGFDVPAFIQSAEAKLAPEKAGVEQCLMTAR